jgi:hypothetical protein
MNICYNRRIIDVWIHWHIIQSKQAKMQEKTFL